MRRLHVVCNAKYPAVQRSDPFSWAFDTIEKLGGRWDIVRIQKPSGTVIEFWYEDWETFRRYREGDYELIDG